MAYGAQLTFRTYLTLHVFASYECRREMRVYDPRTPYKTLNEIVSFLAESLSAHYIVDRILSMCDAIWTLCLGELQLPRS